MAIRFDQIQLSDDGNHLYPYIAGTDGYLAVQTTSGLLRIGAANSSYSHFYTDRASYYFNTAVAFDGNLNAYDGNENLSNWNNIDASLFRSKADTSYYVDPDGTSIVKYLGRKAHQEGLMVGGYNNIGASHAKTNPIFTIGSSYLPNETGLSNMYGIGYTRGDMSAMPGTNGWGMYVAADGDARIFLDGQNGGVGTAQGSWRAPIFYDSDNTGYYINPASTSTSLNIAGNILAGPAATTGGRILAQNYSSGHNLGVISSHYSNGNILMGYGVEGKSGSSGFVSTFSNFSGDRACIEIGSGSFDFRTHGSATNQSVGGDVSMTSRFSVSSGGIATATESFRAPIFYDSNNTNYYLNPASTSKTSINIIDGRLTIGQSTDAGSTYRLYSAAGGQVYLGGHTTSSSITMNGTLNVTGYYANVGNLDIVGVGNSPIDSGTGGGTGSGSGKLLGYNQLNGSERATATLGVNNYGIVMEYEKIFTFKVTGSGWLNRASNPYKLIQAPGADKIIVVDEFSVYIDYETRTGISSSGIARPSDTNAYVIGFYQNETGQSTHNSTVYDPNTSADTAFGITMSGNTFYTLGVMPRSFMANTTSDRGYYRDVPVHQSALIPNRSLFWYTKRNCTSTSNAPGGAHYIKVKYRVIDISAEFSDNGVNHIIDKTGTRGSGSYDGQFAHLPDLTKNYNDAGSAVQ